MFLRTLWENPVTKPVVLHLCRPDPSKPLDPRTAQALANLFTAAYDFLAQKQNGTLQRDPGKWKT